MIYKSMEFHLNKCVIFRNYCVIFRKSDDCRRKKRLFMAPFKKNVYLCQRLTK